MIVRDAEKQLDTPVLFLVFNQPEITERVFAGIRKAKPRTLFVAADGPREDRQGEDRECEQVREIVTEVDWECDLHTNFRDRNLGCRAAVSSAISWFFEHVSEGIILEYDCLPSLSFFWFCQEVLSKYRDDDRIMQINGNFYLQGSVDISESYYFSKLNGCWGWATWKRAWDKFDPGMKDYESQRHRISEYYENEKISDWMLSYLDEAAQPNCAIWSTQWSYAILRENGLCVNPVANLVRNIGFENNPTSGFHKSFLIYNKFPLEEIDEIVHPDDVVYDVGNDLLQFEEVIMKSDPRLVYKGYRFYLYRLYLRMNKIFSRLFHAWF